MSASRGGRGPRGGKGGIGRIGDSGRGLGQKLRPGKQRSDSSRRWLSRQLSDRYVAEARLQGYRSRAAFKLAQIDDRARFLKPGVRVVDLGAAPGGWTQVAVERVMPGKGGGGRVVGIDISEVEPIPGAILLLGDVRAPEALIQVRDALEGPAEVVLSDMAAPSTGHAKTDHLRIMGLVETALDFAEDILAPGGTFVAKVLQGGTEAELLNRLKRRFDRVRHVKPPASRRDSAEMYVVATGFQGAPEDGADAED